MPSVTGKGLRLSRCATRSANGTDVSMPSVTGKGLRLTPAPKTPPPHPGGFNALRNGQGSATPRMLTWRRSGMPERFNALRNGQGSATSQIPDPRVQTLVVSMPSVTGKGLRHPRHRRLTLRMSRRFNALRNGQGSATTLTIKGLYNPFGGFQCPP